MEAGGKESFKKKLVRSWLKWAGHVERTGDGKKQMPRKQRVKGGEEDQACDGRSGERPGKSGRRMENNSKR